MDATEIYNYKVATGNEFHIEVPDSNKLLIKVTNDDIQAHRYIEYHRDLDDFWEALSTGSQIGWIMNYPDNNILFEIGGRGLRLPQKSTYFFPKLPTGMVFRELEE